MLQKSRKFIIFLLSLHEYAIIVNNIVMCWNKPWQYGRKRVDALPSSRAFLYIDTEEIFYVCEL